ncbi:hypothetical protein QBC40DRAFT_326518 [Triangularia verruculosa]|uniref:Uncharacterized protein n=1 Tax=Triangularia verruculosa TaxID=2587418 RepID=A0AAN7AW42_9PEZI|nr:hypothetical protein QBC40DRAFT_326518 [Triangularia verruculosa]
MLRRRSLKSNSDLNRRKSTSSTHGVHLETIDPALAQRDAQIAACQAYTRAQSRANAEMSLFSPTPESLPARQRSKRSSWGRDDNGSSQLGREGEQGLRRQQSVRLVGPCSVQSKKSSGGLRAGTGSGGTSSDLNSDAVCTQGEFDNNSSLRCILGNDIQPSPQPSKLPRRAPPPVPVTVLATDYLNVMAAEEDCYTPEDDKASAPSSYRRLRRSRSMFGSETQSIRQSQDTPTPVLNGKSFSSRPLPGSQSRRLFHSEPKQPKAEIAVPQLRAPKSMSFLRNRHLLRSGSSTGRDNNTRVACVTAGSDADEGRYEAAGLGRLPLESKATALFGSRSRRAGSGMRKSLRSSSSESPPPEKAPVPLIEKPDGLKHKARKVSKSFKTKLKNFFTLSRSEDEPPSIPSQHIEAHKTHVTESFGNAISHALDTEDDVLSEYDWRPIQNVPAKIPSLQNVPSNLLHSNKGSLESLRSESQRGRQVSEESGLTSWVHSGPSTLTSQQQQQWREWERQRLSIIKENGMHATSSSLRNAHFSSVQHASSASTQDTPSSSFRRKPLGAHLFEQPTNTVTADSQRVYSALVKRMKTLNEQVADIPEPSGKDGLPLFAPATHHGCSATPHGDSAENGEDLNRDSETLVSPTSHLFRTQSPYRHALQRTMEQDQRGWRRPIPVYVSSSQEPDDCTPVHASTADGHQWGNNLASETDEDYTESIYSTDEMEAAPVPTALIASTSDQTPKVVAGRFGQPPIAYQPAGYRESSSVSSVDWKTWLSANIAKLDSSPTPTKPSKVEYTLPTMPKNFSRGHVREAAQIYNDDDADYFELPTRKVTMPATPTPLTPVEPNVLKLFPTQRSVKRTTPPSASGKTLTENDSPSAPPPIPTRSALRPSPLKISRPGTGRSTTAPSISSSPGLTAAVQRQFGPVSGYNGRGLSHWPSGKLSERERTLSSAGTRAFI